MTTEIKATPWPAAQKSGEFRLGRCEFAIVMQKLSAHPTKSAADRMKQTTLWRTLTENQPLTVAGWQIPPEPDDWHEPVTVDIERSVLEALKQFTNETMDNGLMVVHATEMEDLAKRITATLEPPEEPKEEEKPAG